MERRSILVELLEPAKKPIERVLSVSAIAISLMVLLLSVWQVREFMAHNRMSVHPDITLDRLASGEDPRVGLYLSSTGLGPAIVREMQIVFDGSPVQDWDSVSNDPSVVRIFRTRVPSWFVMRGDYFLPVNQKREMYATPRENVSDMAAFRDLVYNRQEVVGELEGGRNGTSKYSR